MQIAQILMKREIKFKYDQRNNTTMLIDAESAWLYFIYEFPQKQEKYIKIWLKYFWHSHMKNA